jgi:thioredoxin 1
MALDITNNSKIILALFKNEFCHTCNQVSPVARQVAQQHPDKIDLQEIDISQNPELATKYEVFTLPTFIIIKQGQVIERISGFITKDKLIKKLNL